MAEEVSADISVWRHACPPMAPQACTSIADAARSALAGAAVPLQMAETTLQRMAAGGMYDHVGGGFHRYSVDEHWHVPHFEKVSPLLRMLLSPFRLSTSSCICYRHDCAQLIIAVQLSCQALVPGSAPGSRSRSLLP